jgi:HD-like signal output (HDOD) protein
MKQTIGRFEIRRELDREGQGIVYLAQDPQLQREVAIRAMPRRPEDREEPARLLDGLGRIGKLRHPNVVPIHDVVEQDGEVFLVCEFVEGRSLAQALQADGPMPPVRAADLTRQVADALAVAHALGVAHGCLNASNVLLDRQGVPRVGDFGIVATQTGAGIADDVRAAGLLLLAMLTGQEAADPAAAAVDGKLADIVQRACPANPEEGFAGAAEMRQALEAYLSGGDSPEGPTDANAPGTLEFLLRRMRHRSDFPALSDSVSAINKLIHSDRESINRLSNVILKDYALTNKLLRLVNSAYYRQSGGGGISTVSRAAIVLGFDAIRNIAITVLLFEHLQDKANARELKESFLRANLAGLIARQAIGGLLPREGEEAFICAMFHHLGRLLAQFYFPEETEEIRKLMLAKNWSEDAAAARVLGLAFEDLGMGIARSWGFPQAIVNSMRRLPAAHPRRPSGREESLRLVSGFANELCEAIAGGAAEDRHKIVEAITDRFGGSLQMTGRQLQTTLDDAAAELTQVAAILHVDLRQSPFARQVKGFARAGADADRSAAPADEASMADALLSLDAASPADEAGMAEDAQAVLTAGIQDISNSLVDNFQLNDILRITLETMYRAMGFKRVLLCLKDAKGGEMTGRFGFGPDTPEVARRFRFPLGYTPDVFHLATSKAVDIIIADIDDPKIADRVPAWYRQVSPARTFVLFPLNIKGRPVALIYCDKDQAGSIAIPERELALLKTLRNQALLAIKQSIE